MPAGLLKLYRFVEDAWRGGLRGWCEAGRSSGGASWILAENSGQTRWLGRKLAEAGIDGVRIIDADGLREEFARLAGIEPPPRHLAALALAVKVAEGEAGETTRNADALAEAADALSRAGWHLNQLRIDAAMARRLHRILERAAAPGFFERRLQETLAPQPARMCCVGWDATHWPDIGLLDLAAAKFAGFEMYVPSPRLPADALQRAWIEALEQRLGLERFTCPESGHASENEPLVARLEGSALAEREEVRPPGLLVGREWPDQVGLVCGQVRAWIAENGEPAAPIGVIGPEDSPTAPAVAEGLERAGVRVEHAGRIREATPASLILEQVARYHLNDHDIAELLELTRLLWTHAREEWGALDPETVRDRLESAFKVAQSRNSRILAQTMQFRRDAHWTAVRAVVEALGRWDGEGQPWAALVAKWETLLAALHIPPEIPGAPPVKMPGLFQDERVPERAFMEWVAAELSAARRTLPPPDFAAQAPVVVTSFANAAQQTWERLIFLDSNEHVWPAGLAGNPFLPDAIRQGLNRGNQSGHLLTTHDLRTLEQARFLDLIEHCRSPIAFAGVMIEQTDSGDHAQPNEWVLRAMLETECFAPDFWSANARQCAPETAPALPPEERKQVEIVHGSRRNGTMPFDRCQFSFNASKIEPGTWSATDLDMAIACPATFALKQLFGAQATADWKPKREEGTAVGTRTHRWLKRILGKGGHPWRREAPCSFEAPLAAELSADRRELEAWYAAEGLPMPIWWETCLRKTEWAARRCLREVAEWLLEGKWCSVEQNLAANVRTPAGTLPLKGRVDLWIADGPAVPGQPFPKVRIFDFKTGRSGAPTLATLERGDGAQFAAYYLMARDSGAPEVVVCIIKPEERAREVFGAPEEDALRARFTVLVSLRGTLRFGRRGPLTAAHGPCEELPLATTPIDPAILEQKAGLFLLA